jgi:hypothetical protein
MSTSITDALIAHMTGFTPAQQKASKNVYVAGSGAYSAFNIILNGVTAISPIPERAWSYIFIEPLNEARAINPNQIGTQQLTIEIGVRTNQKDDTSLRKLEAAINTIMDDLVDNQYLDRNTNGLVSLTANYEAGIDQNSRPFARFGNINLVYKTKKSV